MLEPLGAGAAVILMYVLVWGLPIMLAIWFIRTLTTMASAQQEIAQRLAAIESYLRSGRTPPVV